MRQLSPLAQSFSSLDFLGIEEEATLQVREFVMDNARTLLGGDSASVLTVSARLALAAKLACGSEDSGGVLSTLDVTDTLEQVRSRSLACDRSAPCQAAACAVNQAGFGRNTVVILPVCSNDHSGHV